MKHELTSEESTRFAELQLIVKDGLQNFAKVGAALLEISDRRLYRGAGYSTFALYVAAEWNMSAQHAYRLCSSAEIIKTLPEKCHQLVTNEGQTRELSKVPEEKRVEVIEKAAAKGKVTAQSIREIAAEVVVEPPRVRSSDDQWKEAFNGNIPSVEPKEEKPEHPIAEVLRCEIANLEQLLADVLTEKCDCAELVEVITHRKECDKAVKAYQKEKCA